MWGMVSMVSTLHTKNEYEVGLVPKGVYPAKVNDGDQY